MMEDMPGPSPPHVVLLYFKQILFLKEIKVSFFSERPLTSQRWHFQIAFVESAPSPVGPAEALGLLPSPWFWEAGPLPRLTVGQGQSWA